MSVPSKSSKLWWTLLVQSRLLQRVPNNYDAVCNGSRSSTYRGLLGTQWRGFGTKGVDLFRKVNAHEASQPSRWLMHSGFSTEVKQKSRESVVDKKDTGTIVRDTSCLVYVGNLARSVKKKDLIELFGEYGKVLKARVVRYQEDKMGRVFGFVQFVSQTEVESAVAALHRKEFHKRLLAVQQAKVK